MLQLAREQAARLGHPYVGPQHILLGLIREGGGLACAVLKRLLPVSLVELRAIVEKVGPAEEEGTSGARDLPYTTRAERAIELATEEAQHLNHNYVGTEHLLLGLLAEERNIACMVLREQGVTLPRARGEVRRLLAAAPSSELDRSPCFAVRIDDRSPRSIYEQIIEQVQEGVATQRLKEGDRLPTVRRLADQLDIAPGTVARAYGELERLGVVVTEGARGTRVAARSKKSAPGPLDDDALVALLRPVAVAAFHLGASAQQLGRALTKAMNGIFPPP